MPSAAPHRLACPSWPRRYPLSSRWKPPPGFIPSLPLPYGHPPQSWRTRLPRPRGLDSHEDWFNEILARPLFNPDRRPIEAGVRGLPRLTGIVVAGSQRVAIFAGPSNGRPVLAQAGAHIGAYEVRSIADEGVTVVGPTGTSLVRPAFAPARPTAPDTARPATLQPNRPQAK